MKRLILVRHASTIANDEGLLCGSMETEISDKGYDDIVRLIKKIDILKRENNFEINKIYVSESKRTEETIKDMAEKEDLEIVKIKNLGEIDFGDFEGKSFDWIKSEYPDEYNKLCKEGFEYKYPSGESPIDAYEKNKKAIEYILEDMNEDETAIICAHGGSIRNIISYMLCGGYDNHWNFKIDNATLNIIEYDYGFSVLTRLNW